MQRFHFPAVEDTLSQQQLRNNVREFLQTELANGSFEPTADCWVSSPSAAFSEKLGAQGWLGMTWPSAVGGHAKTPIDRLVVTEELLAVGAPVAAHWIADRQSGSQILKFGTQKQQQHILPSIAAGKCYFAIGMSESQAGSDLAAVTTKATKTNNGWQLSGRKIWSTGAHYAHYMIVLARTSEPVGKNRHAGLSQFLVDLSLPGISISGIRDLSGGVQFNETLFENVQLAEDALLGTEGEGWQQVMGELAMERSGPERFLTTFCLLDTTLKLINAAGKPSASQSSSIGRIMAHLSTLRFMSYGIAKLLEQGQSPDTEAALVKELGNRTEREVVDLARELLTPIPRKEWPDSLQRLYDLSILKLPSNTLRGGTSEIMRGIIARQLGIR